MSAIIAAGCQFEYAEPYQYESDIISGFPLLVLDHRCQITSIFAVGSYHPGTLFVCSYDARLAALMPRGEPPTCVSRPLSILLLNTNIKARVDEKRKKGCVNRNDARPGFCRRALDIFDGLPLFVREHAMPYYCRLATLETAKRSLCDTNLCLYLKQTGYCSFMISIITLP